MDSITTASKAMVVVERFLSDGLADCRDSNGGGTRLKLVAAYALVPIILGATAGSSVPAEFDVASLFPAGALMVGMLMGAVSLLFTRVKDAAAVPAPEIGRDPVYFAMVAFRTAKWCTLVALCLNATLLAAVLLGSCAHGVLTGVAVGLMVHLGMKVWNLVCGIGAQAVNIAAGRATPPAPLYIRSESRRVTSV